MIDARAAVRRISEPWRCGDTVKSAINRVSKETGLSHTRIRDIWYGDARRIDAHEIEKIEAAERRKQIKVAKDEYAQLRTQMARLEAMLRSIDPDFHSEAVDALGSIRRQMG
jgi:hypothetical protein